MPRIKGGRRGGRKKFDWDKYSGTPHLKKMISKSDPELEMEQMLERLFKRMDREFIKDFGEQCPTFHWGCIQCKVWEVYERFKKDLTLTYMK